jgi:hypothetical protein
MNRVRYLDQELRRLNALIEQRQSAGAPDAEIMCLKHRVERCIQAQTAAELGPIKRRSAWVRREAKRLLAEVRGMQRLVQEPRDG